MAGGREVQALLAVHGELRVVAGFGQPPLHVLADGLVVLDDQDLPPPRTHTSTPPPPPPPPPTSTPPPPSPTPPHPTDTPTPPPRPCGLDVKKGSKILG